MPIDGYLWNQQDELQFIAGLGAWSETMRNRGPLARRQALEGYLAALPKRERWFPGADVPELEAAARSRLASLTA